jgi:hypothetical protein
MDLYFWVELSYVDRFVPVYVLNCAVRWLALLSDCELLERLVFDVVSQFGKFWVQHRARIVQLYAPSFVVAHIHEQQQPVLPIQ